MKSEFFKMQTTFFLFLASAAWMLIPSIGFSAIRSKHVTHNNNGLVSVEAQNLRLGPLLDEIAGVLKLKVYLYDNSGNDKVNVSVQDASPEDVLSTVLRNRNYCVLYGQDAPEIGVELINGPNLKERYRQGNTSSGVFAGKQNSSLRENNRKVLSSGGASVTSKSATSQGNTGQNGVAAGNESEDGKIIFAGSGVNNDQSNQDDDLEGNGGASEQYSEQETYSAYEDADNDYYAEPDGSYDYWNEEELYDYDTGSSSSSSSTDSKKASLERQIESLQGQIESGEADAWYEKWVGIKGEKYITHPEVTLAQLEEKLNSL